MAHELHIKRTSPISIDEWLSAVNTTENLKIDVSDFIATNPITGAEIRIPGSSETAAVWFQESKEWIKVFRFWRGKVTFKADDWGNENSPVRIVAFTLAQKLDAEIVGDEGEKY